MNKQEWSPPYLLIIIVVVGILTLIFGWKTLIYVVGLFFGITLCVWIYDKITGGPQEVIEEADAPILLKTKVGETASADTPALEEDRPADSTSGAAEFLGCVGFFGAIFACLFLPPLVLGFLGPWGGIVTSVVCAGLWIKFGPPPFPGLLPGCLAIVIPLNALVIVLISLYKLIWH